MKTKILFYIDTLNGGGAEKVLRDLVNSMDQEMFDITVQTTWAKNQDVYLRDGINYKYCYKKRNRFTDLLFRLQAELGLVYPLYIKDDYDIEVAYLECTPTKIIASSTNKKAKKLAWVHCDLRRMTEDSDSFAEKSKFWYKKFNQVICVSKNAKESFIELFGEETKTNVIYNTVDDNQIIEKSKEPLPDGVIKRKTTLLMIGSLITRKNYPRFIKTVKTLLNEGFDFECWILGEGEERKNIEEYIRNNGLNDRIFLLGFHNNPYPFILNADLLVCSSNAEGFSTFVTEGLVLGKPIVTTDCGGMDELLGNSEYGLITENDDEAFLKGLRTMLSDSDLLKTYSEKAKTRGQQFTKTALTEQTQNLFYKILDD